MPTRLIPRHVAVVMDGNGRWAQKRFLPRVTGHRQGVEAVRALIRSAGERGVESKQSILDAMSRPAEKVKPWFDYRNIFLTPGFTAATSIAQVAAGIEQMMELGRKAMLKGGSVLPIA